MPDSFEEGRPTVKGHHHSHDSGGRSETLRTIVHRRQEKRKRIPRQQVEGRGRGGREKVGLVLRSETAQGEDGRDWVWRKSKQKRSGFDRRE